MAVTPCDITEPSVAAVGSDIEVIEKYKALMDASTKEGSVYELSKLTILEVSKQLQLDEKTRGEIVTKQITELTLTLSAEAMKTALVWAKEKAETGYSVALLKAQASKVIAETRAALQQVCLLSKETELKCAMITETISRSIRENGRVATSDASNPCMPLTLVDEGLKYEQSLQVEAATYQILADSFRKSGNVKIGVDAVDFTRKGISGDNYGHTKAQTDVAQRQVVSFEDSKRNHAVNASSQTVGQLIASEVALDPTIVGNYNTAMNYLLTSSPTVTPAGVALLDPVTISFPGGVTTDTLDLADVMTAQRVANQITMQINIPVGSNIRNGDSIVIRETLKQTYKVITVTSADIVAGSLVTGIPAVTFNAAVPYQTAIFDIEAYVMDFAGNVSAAADQQVTIYYQA